MQGHYTALEHPEPVLLINDETDGAQSEIVLILEEDQPPARRLSGLPAAFVSLLIAGVVVTGIGFVLGIVFQYVTTH